MRGSNANIFRAGLDDPEQLVIFGTYRRAHGTGGPLYMGKENFFLFGLTGDQVEGSHSWYNPHWHYDNEPETRAALDLIFSDYFSRYESQMACVIARIWASVNGGPG